MGENKGRRQTKEKGRVREGGRDGEDEARGQEGKGYVFNRTVCLSLATIS